MKISKYLILLVSIIGLATFVGCGPDDPDPTVAELIAANGKAWTMPSVDAGFKLTFTQEGTNATTFTIVRGGVENSPVFNDCSAISGNWSVSGSVVNGVVSGEITFSSNGTSSLVDATYDGAAKTLTLSFKTPHPDNTKAGCGNKLTPQNTYVLTQAQ